MDVPFYHYPLAKGIRGPFIQLYSASRLLGHPWGCLGKSDSCELRQRETTGPEPAPPFRLCSRQTRFVAADSSLAILNQALIQPWYLTEGELAFIE